MAVNIRKKNERMRGSKTHGWGAKKKHRGAGNRGGRGMAGTGKRGDAKKPSIWKDKKYFGKHGFKTKAKNLKTITLRNLDKKLESWLKLGKITFEKGVFIIDLKSMKYNKLLGTGKLTHKVKITVGSVTPLAIEKIKACKGSEISSDQKTVTKDNGSELEE